MQTTGYYANCGGKILFGFPGDHLLVTKEAKDKFQAEVEALLSTAIRGTGFISASTNSRQTEAVKILKKLGFTSSKEFRSNSSVCRVLLLKTEDYKKIHNIK